MQDKYHKVIADTRKLAIKKLIQAYPQEYKNFYAEVAREHGLIKKYQSNEQRIQYHLKEVAKLQQSAI